MWTTETLIVVAAVVAVFVGWIYLQEHGRNWRGRKLRDDEVVDIDDYWNR